LSARLPSHVPDGVVLVTSAPARRTRDYVRNLPGHSSTGAFALSGLIYAAWGVVSAVVIVLLGPSLAALVSWMLPLDRVHATAGVVTLLAAGAGLGAPVAVTRLRRPSPRQTQPPRNDG